MATIGTLKTLVDWTKDLDPDGATAAVAELLSQKNGMVNTMLWKEGNLPTGERMTQRTGLPTAYWRLINQGVPPSKATSAQVDVACGMLSQRSEIDRKIVELNGNTANYRLLEADSHMESMAQEFSSTTFYGTAANPEEFVGLTPQFDDLSASNGKNIISGGGSTNLTSVWLIGWGDNSVYGVFPKGSMAGLQREDLGIIDAFDDNTPAGRFRAYAEVFEWDGAIAVKDWRYAVRVANIDTVELAAGTGTQASTARTNLMYQMDLAASTLHSLSGVRPVYYANRTALAYLRHLGLDKSNNAVTVEEALNQFGDTIHVVRYCGIPVELDDAITNAETQVS